MRRAAFAAAIVLAVGLTAACVGGDDRAGPTTGVDGGLAARLQQTLDEGTRAYGITGASAAVLVEGQGLWSGSSGRVSRGGASVTPATPFNVGSVTKTFVAALVLDLAADGLLRLDDPLARWLPSYPGAGRITLRQLLNHTSGLADYVDNPAYWEAAAAWTSALRTVERVLRFTPKPLFEPGERLSYSNSGYLLLGRVVEEATGSSVGRQLNRRLLDPLGLPNVVYPPEEPVPPGLAHAYLDVDDDGDTEDLLRLAHIVPGRSSVRFGWTDGGMVATPRALARWGDALFRGRVLDRRRLNEMQTFVESGSADYGLGLERKRVSGHVAWGHSGENLGYRAELWHFPDAGVTIAVVWNEGEVRDDLLLQGLAAVALE